MDTLFQNHDTEASKSERKKQNKMQEGGKESSQSKKLLNVFPSVPGSKKYAFNDFLM